MIITIIITAAAGTFLFAISLCKAAKKADTLYTALRSKRD